MKTITEIKAMPLIDRQKLVVDLRNVPAKDKFYATALQLIGVATGMKDWEEPKPIEVKNVAGHDITVDRTTIAADGTGKVFPWQYVALSRFLEATDKEEAEDALKAHVRKPSRDEGNFDLDSLVEKKVTEKLKAMGIKAVAALILFAFMFRFAGRAGAQVQTYDVGSTPGLYHVFYIGGLNGGTNAWTGDNAAFTNATTVITTITTNANWQIISGVATNEYYTSTNSYTNILGVISLVNYDEAELSFGFDPMQAAGGVTGGTASFDYSSDMQTWQLNALQLYIPTNVLNYVETNYFFPIGTVPGYLRLDNVLFPGSGYGSNVTVKVGLKPYRTGP